VLKHLRNREDFEQKNLLQKGFTLVELLVVIVILGILAAVVVFAVGGSTDKAQENTCKSERATAEAAIEAYRVKIEAYPAVSDPPEAGDWAPLTSGAGKFLRSAPKNFLLAADGGITEIPAADGGKCEGLST
jgi:general secretion pathway protein G